jgi:hypothetical protein
VIDDPDAVLEPGQVFVDDTLTDPTLADLPPCDEVSDSPA